MKYARLFTIISIGTIGFCLTSVKQETSSEVPEKTCYVYKKKQKQLQQSSNPVKQKQD